MNQDIYSYFDCASNEASYYFFHIPKTAGTSLNAILENVFTKEEICPPHLWHDLLAYDREKILKFKLYRGHFYAMLHRLVNIPLKSFVFLRDPVERALSHYSHVVRDAEHYLHARAIELGSLKKYLEDPVTRETVKNFQSKSLVMNFDVIDLAEKLFSHEATDAFDLEKAIETAALDVSDSDLLTQAKKAIDNFCCIGITDRFEESVKLLNYTFGWDIVKFQEMMNVNTDKAKYLGVSKNDIAAIEKLNSVDIELYQYAVSVFENRINKKGKIYGYINKKSNFVSYAQNFEDIMLFRALKGVGKGFYIDIGAWSPDLDSITRAFYERGWCGINVEPNPEFYRQLHERRPNDKNLQLAVGDSEGYNFMNFLSNPGLSTLDDEIAKKHQEAGWSLERQEVQLVTLATIWQQHVATGQDVHFLKIDVEGTEKAVLNGNNWNAFRPWIVVVEATLPMSQVESYECWEPILVKAKYHFAYADGLNRFYVAEEHLDTLYAFKYPPNFFDNFVLSQQQEACIQAQRAQQQVQQAEARTQQIQQQVQQAQARTQQAQQQVQQAQARTQQAQQQVQQAQAIAQQAQQQVQQAQAIAQQAQQQVQQAQARTQQAQQQVQQAEARTAEREAALQATRKELHKVHQANHRHHQLAETRQQQIQSMLNSASWRVTAPLRWIGAVVQPDYLKSRSRKILKHSIRIISAYPRFRKIASFLERRFPILKLHPVQIVNKEVAHNAPLSLTQLTPRAQQIYTELKVAIERSMKKETR